MSFLAMMSEKQAGVSAHPWKKNKLIDTNHIQGEMVTEL
jgi:hypothetical protein